MYENQLQPWRSPAQGYQTNEEHQQIVVGSRTALCCRRHLVSPCVRRTKETKAGAPSCHGAVLTFCRRRRCLHNVHLARLAHVLHHPRVELLQVVVAVDGVEPPLLADRLLQLLGAVQTDADSEDLSKQRRPVTLLVRYIHGVSTLKSI